MARDELGKHLQRPGKPQVVTVEKRNVFAYGRVCPGISRHSGTGGGGGQFQQSYRRFAASEILDCSIAGPVIHDDNLEILASLFMHRFKRCRQPIQPVEGRDDDGKAHLVISTSLRKGWFETNGAASLPASLRLGNQSRATGSGRRAGLQTLLDEIPAVTGECFA